MKYLRVIVFLSVAVIIIGVLLFIRPEKHKVRGYVADQVLTDVRVNYALIYLGADIWYKYKIPIVIEDDGVTPASLVKTTYSAPKITVRQLLDLAVPKDTFVWREEEGVIHVIAKSLDARPDYQLNAQIEQFSETGDYSTLIIKVLEQLKHRNFREQLTFDPFPYGALRVEKPLYKFKIKARNTTFRQLLDQIALKGDIGYSVRRTAQKDGAYNLSLTEENTGSVRKIKDLSKPNQ